MQRLEAKSSSAQRANELVIRLQQQLVARMEAISQAAGTNSAFEPVEWFRNEGRHGGGMRYVANDAAVFNRGSVNVSQVQYDDDPAKPLASATALSSIIHPQNPLAPSMHLHVSWTEMKSGEGYWRIMADLNPAIEDPIATARFKQILHDAAPHQLDEACAQGDRYFFIPALQRHRGVCHFYLENYATDDAEADFALAERVISKVIDGYADILEAAINNNPVPKEADYRKQLEYHTLYFLQVLTLDRGTTSGLLIHDQNDIGILGSLPARIDKALLASWRNKLPSPQNALLDRLLKFTPEPEGELGASKIDSFVKESLAIELREHYRKHPAAIDLQATANVVPPTVANHS